MTLGDTGVRVRFVGTLAPGLFQSQILMGERHFLEAFPEESGFSFFLFDLPEDREGPVSQTLESRLADFGFDASRTDRLLEAFHGVENTYIATFQALGALGLLLGVLGLATVLARNALEQRGQLALLRAVGYRRDHVARMVLAENAALVGLGFLVGALPALVAIAPVLLGGRGGLPLGVVAALLLALAVTGAVVSWVAVSFIQRLPLVESLRSE
jgi:ABC-type antimicrobial peptide transport system permease subunit